MPGPYRFDRPPMDAHGKPLMDDEPDIGDYGPLPGECEWIENHDNVFIRYAGKDAMWPTGCWIITSPDADDQLLNAAQVSHVAHKLLGMPKAHKRGDVFLNYDSRRGPSTQTERASNVITREGVRRVLHELAYRDDPLTEAFGIPSMWGNMADPLEGLLDGEDFDPLEDAFAPLHPESDPVPYAGTLQEFEWASATEDEWEEAFR
jgi:hypothetical protein